MNDKDTVLITGASSGIGYELAKVFAFHKYNIILVSRNIEKLSELSNILKNEYNAKVDIIAQDLSETGAAKKVFDSVKKMNLKVDILVNNAGVGSIGLFHETVISKDVQMIQLNIVALTEMTKLFTKEMVKRRKGKILNVGSTGSFFSGPFIAVYYATKAYVLSFSKALSTELNQYNISVTALCPGAVKTNFAKNAGRKDMPGAMDAKVVAVAAYKGLLNKILIKLPKNIVSQFNFKAQQKLLLKDYIN